MNIKSGECEQGKININKPQYIFRSLFVYTLPEWDASENKHKHNDLTLILIYNVIHFALHHTYKKLPN